MKTNNFRLICLFYWKCSTMPIGIYFIDGSIVYEYGSRNGFRMPAYHRADVSLTWYRKARRKLEKLMKVGTFLFIMCMEDAIRFYIL